MAKIAFVWYFDKASVVYPNWRDGLRAAIEEIAKKHTVQWYFDKQVPAQFDPYDAIIFWDDSNSGFFSQLGKYRCKKALCLTTMPQNFDNLKLLDAVYCESTPVYEAVKASGVWAIKAFGTDTNFFTPGKVDKDIEYFYPATFSPWKLQRDIAHLGKDLWCVGTVQPDGVADLEACMKNNVHVEIGYFPAEKIKNYYQRAKKVIIPAVHGSERTVLEAMSCNVFPIVTNGDNVKAQSIIEEYVAEKGSNKLTPREFVLRHYSPDIYAFNILKGIGL